MNATPPLPDAGATLVATAWAWRGPWPPWLVIALLAAAFVLAVWHIVREARTRGAPAVAGLAVFRLAAFALVGLLLAQPVRVNTWQLHERPTLAVLLDASRSMALQRGAEGRGGQTRWQAACAALRVQATGAVQAPLARDWDVALLPFAGQLLDASAALAPEGARTDLAGALRRAAERLQGSPLRAAVLVSDGQATTPGNPLEEARRLLAGGVAVHCVGIGAEYARNVRVLPVLAQRFAFRGDPVPFEVRVAAGGFRQAQVPVVLTVNGLEVDRAEVTLDDVAPEQTVTLEFAAEVAGRAECRFAVPLQPGELLAEDNAQVHILQVIDEPIRVLYVENEPRWEYRYLRTALDRDHRVALETLLLVADPAGMAAGPGFRQALPRTREELDAFDLVILGDLPRDYFDERQLELLRDYVVEDGGSVLFLAGERHLLPYDDTPAEMLLPVRLDRQARTEGEDTPRPFRPRRSTWGRQHPILALFDNGDPQADTWEDLPAMWWAARAAGTRAGATVLLEHPARESREGPEPLCALHYVGRGRTLYVGFDETWRWRSRFGNRFFYRFWGQAIQFLGMPHVLGQKHLVQFELPATASAGEPFAVRVRVMREDGAPAADEEQRLVVEREDGVSTTAALRPAGDQAGLYSTELLLEQGGRHRLMLEGRPEEEAAELLVHDSPIELRNPNANPGLLRRIAAVGGGEYVPVDEIDALWRRLEAPPLHTQRTTEHPLWDRPWLLAVAAALLSAEWVARKLLRLL